MNLLFRIPVRIMAPDLHALMNAAFCSISIVSLEAMAAFFSNLRQGKIIARTEGKELSFSLV